MTSDRKTSWPTLDAAQRCPCLSGESYGGCCARYLDDARPAPTAEALMRSRFTAFATGRAGYLQSTWHSSTRPEMLELDPEQRWYRLDILDTLRGGPLDDDGVVTFCAYYKYAGQGGKMQETSSFVREGGRWFYVDALSLA